MGGVRGIAVGRAARAYSRYSRRDPPSSSIFDVLRPEHKAHALDVNLQAVKKAQIMPHDERDHEDETSLRVNIFEPPATNAFRYFAVNRFRIDQFFRVLNKWQTACQFAATKQTLNLITAHRKPATGTASPSLMRKPSYADSLLLPSSAVHQHRHVMTEEPAWVDLSMTSFLDKSNLLKEESMRKVRSRQSLLRQRLTPPCLLSTSFNNGFLLDIKSWIGRGCSTLQLMASH